MTDPQGAYFQQELEVTKQAQIILCIRQEIIRLQKEREKNREFLTGHNIERLYNPCVTGMQHKAWLRLSEPSETNHSAAFIELPLAEIALMKRRDQKRINEELAALERQRKEHLAQLMELRPESTSMSKDDLRFLLKSPTTRDDDDVSSDSD